MIKMKFNALFFLVCFISLSSFSQTRKELENQRKQLQADIAKVNRLIFDTKKKEKNALDDLSDINQKISFRAKLIQTINLEAQFLSKEIIGNERKIAALNKKLTALKEDYAEMIFKSYKSKSQQSRTMFLLSSDNFYQAYKRLEYMKQYTTFREKQGKEILDQTSVVKKLNDSLLFQKQVKDTLILSEKNQKDEIEFDKKSQEKIIAAIKKREGKYRSDLRKKLNEEKKIAAKIDKIIKDAIAKANSLARAKTATSTTSTNTKEKPTTTKKNEFILSPAAKALAANFELNKGRLPWPLKESIITRKFGQQKHPTIGGITINSTGLHFTTNKGAYAECIFDGKVLAVQVTSEGRKNVLVQHGNYITAYNNLENSLLHTGDNVARGQKIGQVFTDKVSGKTTLIFVLFKNTLRLNPSSWLLGR